MSSTTMQTTEEAEGVDRWTETFERQLPRFAIAGPAITLVAALCVTAGVQQLPGDLDWISEPEGFFGLLAVPFLFATWVAVGRVIAARAVRTGIAVTILGAVAAGGWSFPMGIRLFSADLVLNDLDATAINDTWEGTGSLWSALSFALMTLMVFVVAIVAGIAILRTRVAPRWAAVAFLAFPPLFMTAQAAYVAIEITYPLASACLLAGVAGTVLPSMTSNAG